jgi:NADH-quinone oxidoreductase subunit M
MASMSKNQVLRWIGIGYTTVFRGVPELLTLFTVYNGLGIILNAGYFLWLYQRMFFGNITNPKNEKLQDLNIREWAYMIPLMILSLWIGVYPKPFLEYIQQPVNAIVKQVRPDYVIPGTVAPAQAERAQK